MFGIFSIKQKKRAFHVQTDGSKDRERDAMFSFFFLLYFYPFFHTSFLFLTFLAPEILLCLFQNDPLIFSMIFPAWLILKNESLRERDRD